MAVMRILIDNLKYQDTNLTHLILGFDITALQKTDLQKNAYHPLEIILSSLQESEFSIGNPDLTVQYYEYVPCAAMANYTGSYTNYALRKLHRIRPSAISSRKKIISSFKFSKFT